MPDHSVDQSSCHLMEYKQNSGISSIEGGSKQALQMVYYFLH